MNKKMIRWFLFIKVSALFFVCISLRYSCFPRMSRHVLLDPVRSWPWNLKINNTGLQVSTNLSPVSTSFLSSHLCLMSIWQIKLCQKIVYIPKTLCNLFSFDNGIRKKRYFIIKMKHIKMVWYAIETWHYSIGSKLWVKQQSNSDFNPTLVVMFVPEWPTQTWSDLQQMQTLVKD